MNGTELPLVFKLSEKEGLTTAVFRSPKQMTADIPAAIEIKGKTLILGVPAVKSRFEGTLDEAGTTATGHWHQGGNKLPLVMKKSVQAAATPKRPQHPKPPFPYTSEEVAFQNASAGVKLAGTLTLPASPGPHPAVIMISGSGQQDRDETLFDHKPFLVIADQLSRAGIAVLRYDDRGVGQSTGANTLTNATSADFATDARAAFDFLAKRPDISAKRLGIIGHSEGGLIAPMVAGERPVAALVHLAGPTQSGAEILRHQFTHMLRELPESQRDLANTFLNKLIDALKSAEVGKADPKFLRKLYDDHAAALPEADRKAFTSMQDYIFATGKIATVPWTHYFIKYDPAAALQAIKCPLLALYGEKDVQVPAKTNAARLRELLAQAKSVTIREMPGLNHLFQTAKTGEGSEYSEIEQTFAPEALSAIADFLKKSL